MQIESLYFTNYNHVEYEVIKRTYNPKMLWDTGVFFAEERINTFTYTKP
jgi:hypothetical protein